MSLQRKEINDREKAAIFYHVFAGVDDWRTLYKIADPKTDRPEGIKFFDTYVSKWKNSDKIKAYLQEVQELKARQQLQQREIGQKEQIEREQKAVEGEHTESKPERKQAKIIDYSDPKNRQQLYNNVIARSQDDPKTQLDAAKMFEQIQKDDREAAKLQKVQRVYLPIVCSDCPLYLKARKKTTK